MERGSDKHGPHVDEAMKDEVEPIERGAPTTPRVEEFRDPEASGDDQPPSASRLTSDPIELRAEIARSIDRVVWPSDRDGLLADAEEHNARPEVLGALQELPEGVTFENVQAVWVALGGEPEERF